MFGGKHADRAHDFKAQVRIRACRLDGEIDAAQRLELFRWGQPCEPLVPDFSRKPASLDSLVQPGHQMVARTHQPGGVHADQDHLDAHIEAGARDLGRGNRAADDTDRSGRRGGNPPACLESSGLGL